MLFDEQDSDVDRLFARLLHAFIYRSAAWTNTLFLSPRQRRGGLASVSAAGRAGAALSNKKTASEVEPL